MANPITNKHKKQEHGERPTAYAKRLAARRIRRSAKRDTDDNAGPLPHRPSRHAERKALWAVVRSALPSSRKTNADAIRPQVFAVPIATAAGHTLQPLWDISCMGWTKRLSMQGMRQSCTMRRHRTHAQKTQTAGNNRVHRSTRVGRFLS